MQITVPFAYTLGFIPPRCRNAREAYVLTETTVDLASATPEQAPVAIRYDDGIVDPKPVELRWFGGCLYEPLVYKVSRQPDVPQSFNDLVAMQDKAWGYGNPLRVSCDGMPHWATEQGFRGGVKKGDIDAREIVSSNRERVRRQVLASASDLLVVDGMIWQKTTEPMYVVMTFGLGCNHGGTAVMTSGGYNGNINKGRYFRADQLDAALAAGAKIAEARGDTNDLPMKAHKVYEVLIPEAIQANPQAEGPDGDPFLNSLYEASEKGGAIGSLVAIGKELGSLGGAR